VVRRVVKSNEILPPAAEVTETLVVRRIDDDPKRAVMPAENEMIDDPMIDHVHEVAATRHHRIVIVAVVAARHHRIVIVVVWAAVNDDPTREVDHETSHNDEVLEEVTVQTDNVEPPIETLIDIRGLDPGPERDNRKTTTSTEHDDIDRNPEEQGLEMSSTRRIAIEKVVDDVDHNHEIEGGKTRVVAETPTIMTTTIIMTTILVDEIDGIDPAPDPGRRPVVVVTRRIPTGDGIDPDPEHRPVVVMKVMRMAGDGIDHDPEHRPVVMMRMTRLTTDGVEKKLVPDHEHHPRNEMSQTIHTRTSITIGEEGGGDLPVETVMNLMTITTTTNERDFDPGHDDLKWRSSEVIVDPLHNDLNPTETRDSAIDPNQERGVQTLLRMIENLVDHPDRLPTMSTTIKVDRVLDRDGVTVMKLPAIAMTMTIFFSMLNRERLLKLG
jgi:hypothetical protein